MSFTRREFLKFASAGTIAAVGVGFLPGCAPAPAAGGTEAVPPTVVPTAAPVATPAPAPIWDYEVDVVVMGGGNGGLSAAAAAAEEGKRVLLLEISGYLGGGSAYSGGTLHAWGLETWEEYNKHTEGLHDQILAKKYVETLRKEYIPWLQSIGVPLTRHTGGVRGYTLDWGMGSGEKGYLRHKAYFDALATFIEGKGGTILLNTRGMNLAVDENGTVCGVVAAKQGEDTIIMIKAGAVILATGGFQANHGLMAQYMGPNGDQIRNQGVPYNTGSGMLMAQGVGAMTSGSFSTFSGTLCAFSSGPFTEQNPEEYEKARGGDPQSLTGISGGRLPVPPWVHYTFEEETQGVMVNLDGKRFIDETSPVDAKYARPVQMVAKQKRCMAFMIADKTIYDKITSSEAIINMIEPQGVKVYTADTLEELGAKMQEGFGLYKETFLKTMAAYNEAAAKGNNEGMEVSRTANHEPIETGPFYAIPVMPNAYHTFGGLAINENAQVLDVQFKPIANLYAAPPTAAMFREVYCGGIASAGTFGYIAGKHCAK